MTASANREPRREPGPRWPRRPGGSRLRSRESCCSRGAYAVLLDGAPATLLAAVDALTPVADGRPASARRVSAEARAASTATERAPTVRHVRQMYTGGKKLGLGSSAAALVAVARRRLAIGAKAPTSQSPTRPRRPLPPGSSPPIAAAQSGGKRRRRRRQHPTAACSATAIRRRARRRRADRATTHLRLVSRRVDRPGSTSWFTGEQRAHQRPRRAVVRRVSRPSIRPRIVGCMAAARRRVPRRRRRTFCGRALRAAFGVVHASPSPARRVVSRPSAPPSDRAHRPRRRRRARPVSLDAAGAAFVRLRRRRRRRRAPRQPRPAPRQGRSVRAADFLRARRAFRTRAPSSLAFAVRGVHRAESTPASSAPASTAPSALPSF